MRATFSRRIRGCWSAKRLTTGCGPSCVARPFLRRLFVLLSLWALLVPAQATIDEAISSALQAIEPYAKQGYTVHEGDEWGGDLGVNERQAIRQTLRKGTDYWFCLGADLDSARVGIHVYDERGRLAEDLHCRRQVKRRRPAVEGAHVDWRYLLPARQPMKSVTSGQ